MICVTYSLLVVHSWQLWTSWYIFSEIVICIEFVAYDTEYICFNLVNSTFSHIWE